MTMRKIAMLTSTLSLLLGMATARVVPELIVVLLLTFGSGLWAAISVLAALGGGIAGMFFVDEGFWRLVIAAAAF
jgi:hypothetical protein